MLGTASFATTAAGYNELLAWLRTHGDISSVGVEGTGSYGAGLARHLTSGGGTPSTHDGPVEVLRALKSLHRSANKARTQAINQIRAIHVTAPDELRERLRHLTRRELLATCAAFRIAADDDSLAGITRLTLRELAARVSFLDNQIKSAVMRLKRITEQLATDLVAMRGVGPDTASTLLITAGDNPDRLRNERTFASLTGSCPVPATSGLIKKRYRLNRGGDRQANAALWRIAMVRMSSDQTTRDYIAKRQTEGKTKVEAMRCLKRYIAREVYNALPKSALC